MSVDELTAISRFYGADRDYVVAGGGNTSFKDGDVLYIKGSGASLAEVENASFVRMDRRALAAIWEKTYRADPDEREGAVLADMMAARKRGEEHKRPSVETLLHDLLPFAFVVHTHPALVNGLTCSQNGEAAAGSLFGDDAVWIPSINPGYILSLAVKRALEECRTRKAVIFLQNHGVFVGADSPEGIKERYRFIMEKIGSQIKRQPDLSALPGESGAGFGESEKAAAVFAELAGGSPVSFLRNREIAALTRSRDAFSPVSSAFTPDHIVYAGSDPLFVELPESEIPGVSFAGVLERAWKEHVNRTGRAPRIAAVRGMGVFGIAPSDKAVKTALELFIDAVKVAVYAESFGGPLFMSRDKIDFINNWEVERYRSQVAGTGPSKTDQSGKEGASYEGLRIRK
ncbi:MAG: class II aldolase/adducin family protein [Treponema sp.]|nr:class II aldolase/adducin family protein [Treponema sp.]